MPRTSATGRRKSHLPAIGNRARTLSKKALCENEDLFQTLVKHSSDAIVLLNSDGTVRYESPSYEPLLGYKPEERIGDDLFGRIHPDDIPHAADALDRILKDRGGSLRTELRVRHKNGSWIRIEAVGTNCLDDPAVAGIIVNLHEANAREDIQERPLLDEEDYRTILLENSSVAITIADEKENIVHWNRFAEILLGMDKADLYMKPVHSLYPDEEWTRIRAQDIRRKGMQHHLESRIVKKNQEIINVDLSLSVLKGPDGRVTGSIGIIADITARRRAQEQLQLVEENYRTIFENSSVAITIADENENIVSWNRLTEVLLGLDKDNLYMMPVRSMYPEEEWRKIRAKNVRQKGMEHHIETRILKKDQEVIDVDLSLSVLKGPDGKVTGSIGVITDITERQRAREQLKLVEENYKTIFENTAVAITVTDENERIVRWNRFAEALLGMDKDDLYMMPVSALYPLEEWGKIRAQNVRQKGMQHHLETRILKKNRATIDVDLSLSVLKGPDGNVTGSIGVISDITERKRMDEALHKAREELELRVIERTSELAKASDLLQIEIGERQRADEDKQRMEQQLQLAGRLAAVGELAAGIAHELNNPLTAVQGFAELLIQREDLDETTRSDIENIYRQAQRAIKTTSNLLSFARRHKPEKSLISLNDAIEKSLELHAYRMKVNNIAVSMELAPDLPNIMADYHQMQQVFLNIVTNAEHAMYEAKKYGELRIKTQRINGNIRITFADDGPGIAEDDLNKIFDPFFTTKEVGKGTGLGLSICFGIVHEHGGRLYVESLHGAGATFVIEIPIISENQPDAEPPQLCDAR